ncbi:Hemin uptake protein [Tritonibacter multivorans]|uniref:Hemin uptake protein n=1 Tax=Tritonibacter multivorans TaxID=928856 RepID=A0A0P1G0R2_9RHOB|nr:hemin uptake protein HemP [Tritonibacter multivorans]MDA7419368.1 hemin uptake protein HemP [Tritonibacter multivorans]CUH75322.1 Hemin uptake protein [Tritonibacter multivorans]SFD21145.1 Hemin uptake protein hemP [Tritonibacter multivorans]
MNAVTPLSVDNLVRSATSESFPTHDAVELTKGGNQARIVLNGQIYSLRITRAGKLILTK